MVTGPKIISELKRIATANDGILVAEHVVEAAKRAASPLHNMFDWDDSEAANKWRIHQARQLIRVTVEYIGKGEDKIPMRVFVSLTDDRVEGGYRVTAQVLSDAAKRKQMLDDAIEEMNRFRRKYAALKELAEVFEAMRKAAGKKAA